jgi:hypothetical protein
VRPWHLKCAATGDAPKNGSSWQRIAVEIELLCGPSRFRCLCEERTSGNVQDDSGRQNQRRHQTHVGTVDFLATANSLVVVPRNERARACDVGFRPRLTQNEHRMREWSYY